MLRLHRQSWLELLAHLNEGLPEEACGLLAGSYGAQLSLEPTDGSLPDTADEAAAATATRYYPCANLAASAKLYTIDPHDHLRADRDAEDAGLEIIGVVHSHTHTDPYPSPTDVAEAPDPTWHYVIVSFREPAPMLRSYRIVGEQIVEEPVVLID
jgi:[CysO sulfur-carrier protein]-S-L-cysteine hydrolase